MGRLLKLVVLFLFFFFIWGYSLELKVCECKKEIDSKVVDFKEEFAENWRNNIKKYSK